MKNIDVEKLLKRKATADTVILLASIVFVYLLISLYFVKHTFFRTVVNEVDVSLKEHNEIDDIIRSYIKDYRLKIIERDGEVEEITGQDIGMQYNENNSFDKIHQMQNPLKWPGSLLKKQKYYTDDLFVYNKDVLEGSISELHCLNKDIIEPQNVSFKYSNGSYEVIKEIYGNKINRDRLFEVIERNILEGKTKLDLDEKHCYENPKYTLSYYKVPETKRLLDKYVSAQITYTFGDRSEIVDRSIINQWLAVDDNLDAVINERAVAEYVRGLCKKYDTVGIVREINVSTHKIIEVEGGFYGWKINCAAETKALMRNIELGEVLEKEPIYAQKALYRDEDDIGNTYVEINLTKQRLWFYKDGKLIAGGAVVTGNPNKGNATETGVYMLNYKEEGSILRGPHYEAKVTYWMPFNGDIGIHDASWRYSFGGDIYKSNGTHGCVNVPLYLAERIYDNIEVGTPIICYEE